jgi:hypothetical protein
MTHGTPRNASSKLDELAIPSSGNVPDMRAEQVRLERCATGRLRDAYPVHAHDVEVRLARAVSPDLLGALLADAARGVLDGDPECRRVVFAAPADDREAAATARAAGFRHVLDVDLPGAELSLLVAEPGWVTVGWADLDTVPGT